MNQTWENSKKTSFGPDFGPFGPPKLFFKNLASYHGQLSACAISEKTNDPILRKLTDGWTDGRQWFHRTLSDKRRASKICLSNKDTSPV